MPGCAYAAKDRVDEIGQPVALVVGGDDDRERGWRAEATGKDETRKHYNPGAPARECRPASSWRSRAPCCLCALPSLVQPMGADQGLYAYVGERILAGELPYRDAWDQKPPAIHLHLRAACARVWPSDGVVAGRRPVAAAAIAWLLCRPGARRSPARTGGGRGACCSCCCRTRRSRGSAASGCGRSARRSSRVAVTAAFVCCWRSAARATERRCGACSARACCSALAFAVQVQRRHLRGAGVRRGCWLWQADLTLAAISSSWRRVRASRSLAMLVDVRARAARCAISTTRRSPTTSSYSGETYAGPLRRALRYLLTFPIERARVDALWTVGGAGCLVLLVAAR